MSSWLILAIAVVYLVVAVDFLIQGQAGLAVTFVGFCLGNLGLYLQT